MRTAYLRVAGGVFAGLCLAWALAIHALYVATLHDEIAELWIAPLRGTAAIGPAVLLLFLQYPVSAAGFLLAAVLLRPRVRSPARFGLLGGALFGLWANTQFLLIPYAGAYTSLPAVVLGSAVTGGANQGPAYWLTTLAGNLIFWPLVGWFIGRLTLNQQSRRQGAPGRE